MIQLSPTTQAAVKRIATAPATSEQGYTSSSISLKRNNRPTEPGLYLCCRTDYSQQPALARIDDDLTMVIPGGCVMPLARCERSTLWSDRLTVAFPKPLTPDS